MSTPYMSWPVGTGVRVIAPPRNLFYGARQMLIVDPNGMLVDISSPAAMSEEFSATLVQDGDTIRQRRPTRGGRHRDLGKP
jgi:hypothetical protein